MWSAPNKLGTSGPQDEPVVVGHSRASPSKEAYGELPPDHEDARAGRPFGRGRPGGRLDGHQGEAGEADQAGRPQPAVQLFVVWQVGPRHVGYREAGEGRSNETESQYTLFFPPTLLTLVLTNTICLFACTANQRNNRRQDPKVDDPTQGLVAGNEGKFFDVFAPAPKKIPDQCPFAVVALSFESLTYHVYNFTPF